MITDLVYAFCQFPFSDCCLVWVVDPSKKEKISSKKVAKEIYYNSIFATRNKVKKKNIYGRENTLSILFKGCCTYWNWMVV